MAQIRFAIDIGRKQEAIEWIKRHGQGIPSRAAAHFRKRGWEVDAATFRAWWRKRGETMAAAPSQKRLKGGGWKPALRELEDALLDSIVDRRLRREKVTREWIASAARDLYGSVDDDQGDEFVASHRWVSSFMRRNDLSLHRRTNLTILTDDQLVDRAVSYMRF